MYSGISVDEINSGLKECLSAKPCLRKFKNVINYRLTGHKSWFSVHCWRNIWKIRNILLLKNFFFFINLFYFVIFINNIFSILARKKGVWEIETRQMHAENLRENRKTFFSERIFCFVHSSQASLIINSYLSEVYFPATRNLKLRCEFVRKQLFLSSCNIFHF